MSSQTKDSNLKHLELFASLVEKSKVNLEFEDPEELKKLLDTYRDHVVVDAIHESFRHQVRVLIYELDVRTRKIVSMSVGVNCWEIGYTEYAPFVENNLSQLRSITKEYNILDITGAVLLTFSEDNPLNFNHFEGISYLTPYYVPLNDHEEERKKYIEGHQFYSASALHKMYGSMALMPKQHKFLEEQFDDIFPYYTTFSKNLEQPVKYAFNYGINPDKLDVWEKHYGNYVNMKNTIEFIKVAYDKLNAETISFQMSPVMQDYFAVEFYVTKPLLPNIIEEMRRCNCFDGNILQNLAELQIPDYLSNCVLKFRWENRYTQECKFYMETDNKEHILTVV